MPVDDPTAQASSSDWVTPLVWGGRLVGSGDELNTFASALSQEQQSDVLRALGSGTPEGRLLGVLRLLSVLCHGADTRKGLELSEKVVSLLRRDAGKFHFADGNSSFLYSAAALNANVQAQFLEGAWGDMETLLSRSVDDFPGLAQYHPYWNAMAMLARALLRQNRVAEASRVLGAVPELTHVQAPQISLAHAELRAFERKRFELDRKQTVGTRADEIWIRSFEDVASNLENLRRSLPSPSRPSQFGTQHHELLLLVQETADLLGRAREEKPFEEKYAELAVATERWHDRIRRFVHPNLGVDHVNFEWIGRCLHRAGVIQAVGARDAELVARVRQEIDAALPWTQRTGDVHGRWMLLWAQTIVLEKLSDSDAIAASLRALCDALDEARAHLEDYVTRSNVANFFPELASKTCRLLNQPHHQEVLVRACELRKSRSLLATRADAAVAGRLHASGPEALGVGVHYLSYVVFEHENEIRALLYSADGTITAHHVPVGVRTVRNCLPSLGPAKWKKISTRLEPPRIALAGLLAPIADAWASRRIRPGDHLCVAADDPVHVVPLHYLDFGDGLLLDFVTMSRVASFTDAMAIAARPDMRPQRGVAIHVAARVKSPDKKQRLFQGVIEELQQLLTIPTVSVHQGALTAGEVLRELGPGAVIHLDAHGAFPPGYNPYVASGLVVSDGKALPVLDAHTAPLLTPAKTIEHGPNLGDSHVTLNACVSGMGAEGQGGDVLGMEFALRLCGASSVLATHWDVLSASAATFARAFYGRWLGDGLSRAEAVRRTMQALAKAEVRQDDAMEWCAYSLYGDWR